MRKRTRMSRSRDEPGNIIIIKEEEEGKTRKRTVRMPQQEQGQRDATGDEKKEEGKTRKRTARMRRKSRGREMQPAIEPRLEWRAGEQRVKLENGARPHLAYAWRRRFK